MAKNSKSSKIKKNATKGNGLVTSNSINSKKKMYPETSMVCDFFCRYLINSNMFTLEQILNFKTNLRNVLLKKYKQYTWDKKQPLKGNASRSVLVFKSTLDPVLIVAGYKSGILKMDEEDVNLEEKKYQEEISNKNTSNRNSANVATITLTPVFSEDSSSDEDTKGLGISDNSPNLIAIRTISSEKGKIPISLEKFKNIFLTNGEIVLWCDPGSVSYCIDDGQIVTIYDKEKEKLEQPKKANKKGNSPNIKNSAKTSPSVLSQSSSMNSKKSPLVLPAAASPVSKKDKKKNKKKEKKEENVNNKQKASPYLKKETKSSSNSNTINIIKNVALENSPLILPAPFYTENPISLSSNGYSPELSEIPLSNVRRESLLSAIPNNNVLMNNSNNYNYNLVNTFGSMMTQAPYATGNGINSNFSENNHPFISLLSRSAVMV